MYQSSFTHSIYHNKKSWFDESTEKVCEKSKPENASINYTGLKIQDGVEVHIDGFSINVVCFTYFELY